MEKNHKRELYKALRSMHDGICPKCGEHDVERYEIYGMGGYDCLGCGFNLTPNEVSKIRLWVVEFHDLDEALKAFRG